MNTQSPEHPHPILSEIRTLLLTAANHLSGPSTELTEAIRYALDSPGKRLRPIFVLESSARVNLNASAALAVAAALECIHVFSLIHDDLPCLDNDDFRRGLPTVHKKFNEATALLAGDALVPMAFQMFSTAALYVEPEAFTKALSFFAEQIGPKGMIGGQMLELESVKAKNEINFTDLSRIQDLKTGALFRAALLLPLHLKGISETSEDYKAIESFAKAFGFAFQIADDLEDEAQDLHQNSKNMLSLLGQKAAIQTAIDALLANPYHKQFSAAGKLLEKLQLPSRP